MNTLRGEAAATAAAAAAGDMMGRGAASPGGEIRQVDVVVGPVYVAPGVRRGLTN